MRWSQHYLYVYITPPYLRRVIISLKIPDTYFSRFGNFPRLIACHASHFPPAHALLPELRLPHAALLTAPRTWSISSPLASHLTPEEAKFVIAWEEGASGGCDKNWWGVTMCGWKGGGWGGGEWKGRRAGWRGELRWWRTRLETWDTSEFQFISDNCKRLMQI